MKAGACGSLASGALGMMLAGAEKDEKKVMESLAESGGNPRVFVPLGEMLLKGIVGDDFDDADNQAKIVLEDIPGNGSCSHVRQTFAECQ